MKKIIFVVRKFNDVDNMLPLIDKFVLEGHSVRVMSFKPEILKNFLVNFLNGRHGIFIEYPIIHKSGFRVGILYFLSKFLRLIMEKYEKFFTMKYIRFFTMKVEMVLVSVVDRKKNIGDLIFHNIKPDAVIFDKTNIIQGKIYRRVVSYLHSRNIPMIRLDHGMNVLNRAASYVDNQNDLMKRYKYKGIHDFYIFKESLKKNYDPLYLLGSLRYSKEWIKKYPLLYKYDNSLKPKIVRKTVVILLSAEYDIYIKEVAKLINAISNKFDIDILLKPHTRNNVVSHGVLALLNNNARVNFVFNNTAWLIDNSDAVIICGYTSVGVHSIVNKNPLIVAEYTKIPKEDSYYSKFNAACIANNLKDVLLHCDKILTTKLSCYNEKKVKLFLEFMSNPNNSDSVIDDYYNAILKIMQGRA
jgi:hypothetical protein